MTFDGTAGNPIVIEAQEVGGAIINMTTTGQNILNIVRGSFFTLKGLKMTGGSFGIRLGTGPNVNDAVTDALFEDLEIFNTQVFCFCFCSLRFVFNQTDKGHHYQRQPRTIRSTQDS